VKPGFGKSVLVINQSEESFPIQNKRQREILRTEQAHGVTFVGFFRICEGALRDFNSCVEKFVEKDR
jgi:hypothetical protein